MADDTPAVSPLRLREISDGYRVAAEAHVIATKYLEPQDYPMLFDALWELMQREAAKAEQMAANNQ